MKSTKTTENASTKGHCKSHIRNILDLSSIMALGNLKPNISWHSITVWMSLVLNNFIKNRLTEKSIDLRLVLFKGQASMTALLALIIYAFYDRIMFSP